MEQSVGHCPFDIAGHMTVGLARVQTFTIVASPPRSSLDWAVIDQAFFTSVALAMIFRS
jgi:hypothetical protein